MSACGGRNSAYKRGGLISAQSVMTWHKSAGSFFDRARFEERISGPIQNSGALTMVRSNVQEDKVGADSAENQERAEESNRGMIAGLRVTTYSYNAMKMPPMLWGATFGKWLIVDNDTERGYNTADLKSYRTYKELAGIL